MTEINKKRAHLANDDVDGEEAARAHKKVIIPSIDHDGSTLLLSVLLKASVKPDSGLDKVGGENAARNGVIALFEHLNAMLRNPIRMGCGSELEVSVQWKQDDSALVLENRDGAYFGTISATAKTVYASKIVSALTKACIRDIVTSFALKYPKLQFSVSTSTMLAYVAQSIGGNVRK